MLAVEADYETGTAVVGTADGQPVPTDAILAALEKISYRGEIQQ